MGLLITIFLIITNIYNSVNAPKDRGFSFIEMWILGIDFQVLAAIIEYSYVILQKRKRISAMYNNATEESNYESRLTMIDRNALIASSAYFIMFQAIFWLSVFSMK